MKINLSQRIVLSVSALSIIGMTLFPPVTYLSYNGLGEETEVFAGYRFIGTLESNNHSTKISSLVNPDIRVFASIYKVEPTRLSFQLLGTLLVAGFLFFSFQDNKSDIL